VNSDAWPTPPEGASREPLPRVDDLPIAERGYDRDSVKAAFDSFYRHAAQLDAALRTLEAVDSFHRQAAALRADLRTLRSTGWTQQPFPAAGQYGYDVRAPREGISPAVWRVLAEVVFLIAVSVFLGVAKLEWWVIVSVMGGAFLIVALIEWAASRDRWSAPVAAQASAHPVVDAQPSPEHSDEAEPDGWAAFEQPQEPSDAMTMIGVPQEAPSEPAEEAREPVASISDSSTPVDEAAKVDEPEPVVDAVAEADEEAKPEAPAAEVEPEASEVEREAPEAEPEGPEAEPEAPEAAEAADPSPRRRWWRRAAAPTNDAAPEAPAHSPEAPRHVRVLAAEEGAPDTVDPWEQGFDPEPVAGESIAGADPDEDTGEDATPVAAEAQSPSRRRFRRR